jgi:long-chain acyl-CoA synthetase
VNGEDSIVSRLLGAGSPFELADELVLGERMKVMRQRASSLSALLERSASFGELPYLVAGERRISYREHLALVGAAAAALRDRYGVRKGDRVAILAANSPDWIVAFWATVSLGAIAVAMNAWWAGDEIRYALDDAEPAVLIADEPRLARLGGPAAGLKVPVIRLGADLDALLRRERGAGLPGVAIDEDDPALILYTSGTTGRSKGAVLSHRNLIALIGLQSFHGARLALLSGSTPPATPAAPPCLLSSNPLFHVSGLCTGAVAHLAWGAKSVWTTGRFDAAAVMALIERERVTGWAPHGSMAYKVIHHPDRGRYDLSSVRSVGSGGAPVTPAIQAGLREVFPNAISGTAVGYGLTEATAMATLNFGAALEQHPLSVGRPLPTVELEVRGPDGRAVPEGVEGEITLRGPLVMLGYWRRPDDTAAALGPGRWLRTGDVGRLEAGRLYIASRRTDLILRGAENVYPAEIEARLCEHPAVREAAVLGVASPELGQEVKAVVALRDGASATPAALAAWVAERLAYYKVPAHWQIGEQPLPRNASGKVMKFLLATGDESPYVED